MKQTEYSFQRLRHSPLREQLLYRRPMAVTEIHVFPHCQNAPAYPVCPRCGQTMEQDYMAFCSRCGQKLDWRRYANAKIVYMEPNYDCTFEKSSIHSR